MARDYARIMTAIWDNKEFCNLAEGAQRAYLLLVTQKDISAAGVLRMWVPRWVEMSRTSSTESFNLALKELEARRFIVLDFATGELLIRSFIRWDAGFNNPKRRPVIVRAAEEVRSGSIAQHLEVEFRRCGLLPDPPPTPNGGIDDRDADRAPDSLSGADRVDLPNEPFPQVDRLTDSYALDDGLAVTYVSTEVPQPAIPVPPTAGAETPLPGLALVRAEPDPPEANAGLVVAAWAEGFASTGNRPIPRQRSQVGNEAKQLLAAGNDPARLIQVARILGAKGRSTLAVELGIQSTQAPRNLRNSGDDKFRAGLDLADRYEAEDDPTHHLRTLGGTA